MTRTWNNILRLFARSQHGSVMPLVALGMFALIGATGVAVDLGRQEIVQSRMQNALDSAGLAAGTAPAAANLNTVVSNYFYANFPATYLGVTVKSLTVTSATNPNSTVLTLNVSGALSTTFMNIFGMKTISVSASSQVTKQTKGMELVLVMDNTGSMSQPAGGSTSKIQAAQQAATILLNILYGSNSTVPNLWVGLVPFSQGVNIGTNYSSWVNFSANPNFGPVANTVSKSCTSYSGATVTYGTGPTCSYVLKPPTTPATYATFGQSNWAGCVESRSNGTASPAYDITDDPPSTKLFPPYYYASGGYNGWMSTGVAQSCTGGQCTASHTQTGTCTTTYPACCPPGAESCTNQANCGLPPYTYSCTQTICTQTAPQTCTPTSDNTVYNYSLNTTYLDTYQGPNAYCPPQPIQPMVAQESTILAAINNMQPVGETEIDLGLAWAWRLLSPNWQGLWGGQMNANGLPLAYNTPLMTKVVILMTDGDNNIATGYYSAYGLPSSSTQLGANPCTGTSCAQGISVINSRTSNGSSGVCDLMKAKGIIIYTVALGSLISASGQALLQQCATNPSYAFVSPTTNELQGIFQQIGNSLSNLYVSH